MPHILTRQQLHALVWEQPMTTLAKQYGVSDVALHKICRKYNVPRPAVGYWTKKAFGKRVRTTPLPDPADQRTIHIRERAASNEPEAMAHARDAVLEALGRGGDEPAPNPIVECTLARLAKAKRDREGLVRTDGSDVVRVVVHHETVERAGEALAALVAAGEKAGFELVKSDAGAAWHYNGETIAFELIEAADQVAHVATDKELAAVEKWRKQRDEDHRRYGYWSSYGEPKIPKWERLYRGRLMVRLEDVRLKSERRAWGEPILGSFAESRTRKLEKSIPRIIATIAAMAAAKVSNRTFEEQQRVIAAEAARRRAEAERRRVHEEKAASLLAQLIDEQMAIERLRALIVALEGAKQHGRVERFCAWLEERLRAGEHGLGAERLEQRLAGVALFGAEDNEGSDYVSR